MWLTRDKDDDRLWLHIHSHPVLHEYTDYEGNKHERWVTESQFEIDKTLHPKIKFEDGPVEIDVVTLKELLNIQRELKDVYKELNKNNSKTINDLTCVIRSIPLEYVADTIHKKEDMIYSKYNMLNNPFASKSTRLVSIDTEGKKNLSEIHESDNSIREYIVNDKVVASIYVRRNDFNNADIMISDFGDKYVLEQLQG